MLVLLYSRRQKNGQVFVPVLLTYKLEASSFTCQKSGSSTPSQKSLETVVVRVCPVIMACSGIEVNYQWSIKLVLPIDPNHFQMQSLS